MKILRVDDDVHQIITEFAEADDRGLTAYLNRHFRGMHRVKHMEAPLPEFKQEYTAPPVQLTPAIGIDVTPTKKNNSVATPHDLPKSTMRPDPKYCKAGHLLSPTGRCLQKGCKYA